MTKNKILAVVTFSLASLSASAIAEQTMPAAKKYKWHHPWFKRDIVSDSPPSWPYKIIEEKNGVILVEVTPPGSQKESAAPAPAPAPAQEPSKATTTIYRPAKPDKKESCDDLELKVGMKDTSILLCFYPTNINRSVGSYGVHEQWVYREGAFRSPKYSTYDIYLYFENGVLTSFQTSF